MAEFWPAPHRVHHVWHRPGGSERPLVFVNSLGTDLRIWDEVIAHLPKDQPILAYDKSGHGLSEAGAVTMDDFATDLAALMDRAGLRDALICGVSVGGMIAQRLASLRPDLVTGLVLCNTGLRIGTRTAWDERIATLDRGGLAPMADGILERWFAPHFAQRHPARLKGYRTMLTRTPLDGYRTVCAAIRDTDLGPTTRNLPCPTLCIAGAADQATPPEIVKDLADSIPSASYVCLPDTGHLPCLEAPTALAQHLVSHLERLP